MKDIEEYDENTSPYELFEHLHEKVMSRDFHRFSEVMEYVRDLPRSKANLYVFRKIFRLVRELNWGMFARLNPLEYPALWKELVVPNREITGTGDLKRNTSISSLYTAILDIHGYSAFCQKHRRNLSMLVLLDECIRDDIQRICSAHGTLGWRSEGDTIVLIAADPRKITRSVLNIVDYFSRRRLIKGTGMVKSQVVNKIVLPDLAVSAGIAGGRTFTPLVITHDGNISGDIVNSAARLQSFANQLDPDRTRILASNHITHQLRKRRSVGDDEQWRDIDYFFLGRFQFKGMELTIFEIMFRSDQKNKLNYQRELVQLYKALRKGLWRDQIFTTLMNTLSRAIGTSKSPRLNGVSREDLIAKCDIAIEVFNSGKDYSQPIRILEEISDLLPWIPGADPVLSIYALHVLEVYRELSLTLYRDIEEQFEASLHKYLEVGQRDLYVKASKSREIHEKIKDAGIRQIMDGNQKYAWHRLIDEHPELLSQSIYVGKR
jgi:class 3 adenylate cyclase